MPFLGVLQKMEGELFDENGQIKFQTLLLKHRLYKPINLPSELANLYDTANDTISPNDSERLFNFMLEQSDQLRLDPGLRGRNSAAPLTRMGLAIAKKSAGPVVITEFGKKFLNGKIDLGEVFFRFLLKWQIPNPESTDFKWEEGCNIKPFIGGLHLINTVNSMMAARGQEPKGVSRTEFNLFVPTLINHEDINTYADKIVALRDTLKGKSMQEQKSYLDTYKVTWARKFLQTNDQRKITKFVADLRDYGDSATRYFRLTQYVYIRGGGFYIDLEPRRQVELVELLNADDGSATHGYSSTEYVDFLSDPSKPHLPWETGSKLRAIAREVLTDVQNYEQQLSVPLKYADEVIIGTDNELKQNIQTLRNYRRELQELTNHKQSQTIESIENYVETLRSIFRQDIPSLALEKYTALGLHALNDARKIQPNYPVGDDNEPTFTAPAGMPDIESFYNTFNTISEVTMLTGRNQWYNEGQPVMRHLREFEDKNPDKPAYCIFIAPKVHRDTVNTFWNSVKYEYEGRSQKIVPISIEQFAAILDVLISIKRTEGEFHSSMLIDLYDRVVSSVQTVQNATEWIGAVPQHIDDWQRSITT